MGLMGRFEQVIRGLSGVFEYFGLANLLMMVAVTCLDVFGAKVFLRPILGALDIVMLNQLLAISFAATATLLLGRHVQVEFVVMLLPPRLRGALESAVSLVLLVFVVIVAWRLFVFAATTGGEVSATARIPLSPFAYATAISFVPVCLAILAGLLKSIRKIGHA